MQAVSIGGIGHPYHSKTDLVLQRRHVGQGLNIGSSYFSRGIQESGEGAMYPPPWSNSSLFCLCSRVLGYKCARTVACDKHSGTTRANPGWGVRSPALLGFSGCFLTPAEVPKVHIVCFQSDIHPAQNVPIHIQPFARLD